MQHKTTLPLGGLLAALALAGCSNNQPATPPPTTVVTTPPPTVAATPAATPDTKINTNAGPGGSTGTDSATADAVNTAIVHNKQMTGARVEPVVTAGVARLNGTVQNQQQKALAETAASNTPGVTSVINKLQIVATGGAKPKPTVKVLNHTTVINHYIQSPPDSSSGATDSGTTPSSGGSDDTGAAGSGTDSGATPAPPASAPPSGNP